MVKNLPANAGESGDPFRSLGQEDPLEKGMANPLQYCCLGNPMDRRAWWATVHGIWAAKSQIQLQQLSTHAVTSNWC